MRVLIVGCGYVGIALASALAKAGHDVSGLRRPGAGESLLRDAGIKPVLADITNLEDLRKLSPKYDWVMNCVSATGGGSNAYRSVYLEGMRNLIAWLRPAGLTKFVYTSSTSVYAQNDGSVVDEDSVATGVGETGGILSEAEQVLLQEVREKEFPGVILRLSGIYGPGRGYWWKQFLSGEARLEGESSRWLNMVHRDDVVGAVTAALERGNRGAVFNVSDNEPVTQRALFEWLAKELKQPLPQTETHTPSSGKRGASNKRVSNRRLRSELGYEFFFPTFREGYRHEMGLARRS